MKQLQTSALDKRKINRLPTIIGQGYYGTVYVGISKIHSARKPEKVAIK